MGHDLQHICQVKTRRFIWVLGTVFASVLVLQYLELPYGNLIPSLFAVGKFPTMVNNASSPYQMVNNASSPYQIVNNTILLNDLNNTETFSDHEKNPGDDTDPEDESPSKDSPEINKNSTGDNVNMSEYVGVNENSNGTFSGSSNLDFIFPLPALAPVTLSLNLSSPTDLLTNSEPPVISSHITSLVESNAEAVFNNTENQGPSMQIYNSSVPSEENKKLFPAVVSISEMYDMLKQSHDSFRSMKPRWSSPVDQELLYAKSQIENAYIKKDSRLYPHVYQNVSTFRRSYELMEKTLKVYVYKEGESPVFHRPPLKGIYASEGWFMKLLEANKHFVTKNPKEAHLFYLPFSSRALEEALYVPNSHSHTNLIQYLKNYLDIIGAKYPFWNRTGGADHFLVACHDWAPAETKKYMANCIRALCNNDIQEGFVFGKDVSLPETYVRTPQSLLRDIGGKPPSKRPILAFFAGRMHGYLRPILLQHWQDKDPDMKIFGRMPREKGKMNYIQHMKSSKYCICAKGFEVNSPRVVEAIFYECVPVIISDNFVPPFLEALNWESFAVFVPEKDIPNLKKILLSIPRKRYFEMQRRVKKVQQHFLWHAKPEKYDIFHMILHSIWYNRVFSVRSK